MTQQIPDPDTLEFALNLLACEGRDEHAADSPVVFRVTEKLRRPLSRLAGTAGFRSLLSRALTLARVQAPSLSVVQINPDGSLDGLDPLGDPDEASNAGAMLVAQLLALLTLFIGNNLVLSLVSDIWPELESQNRELRSMDEYDPK
jgi:hypothetical protein